MWIDKLNAGYVITPEGFFVLVAEPDVEYLNKHGIYDIPAYQKQLQTLRASKVKPRHCPESSSVLNFIDI